MWKRQFRLFLDSDVVEVGWLMPTPPTLLVFQFFSLRHIRLIVQYAHEKVLHDGVIETDNIQVLDRQRTIIGEKDLEQVHILQEV